MLSDFTVLAQNGFAQALLAQAETAQNVTDSTQFKFVGILAVLVFGIGLPFVIGHFLAKRLRMADHGWRIGLILCATVLAAVVVGRAYDPATGKFNIKLGVDLKGGVILIYEVDEGATAAAAGADSADGSSGDGSISMGALVEAIARRINPSGTKEIVIRPYGAQQVEVIIPEVDQREVELIKDLISKAGVLQFRINANSRDHAHIIELAREAAQDPARKRGRFLRDESGEQIGLWARVGREQQEGGGGKFKVGVSDGTIRDAATGEILDTSDYRGTDVAEFTKYIEGRGINDIDVLMATDDPYSVTGNHLGAVSRGYDESMRPCIMFNLKQSSGGVDRFAKLTTEFGPEGNFQRRLGIILDNTLLSAPSIQEPITQGRGRITGQFTQEEVDFVVNILEAGSLPVVLNPVPISENQISPLLGAETIKQGKTAMTISLIVVLIFILIYYRFAGFVACLALLLNLLFILAMMILIKAAFTLPGLAGLVLTVGMSVDANVLIFERIREELSRGAALRMAIRNGFGRATTTIVDANLTTLITAFVLYGIGTDQIRGFAVTLILGILMSMFTAIFCSRVVFDIAERTRTLKKMSMMQILHHTQIDFIGKRKLAAVFSCLVIGIGIVGIGARGAGIFDIDFRGGTSVQMRLKSSMDTEQVRERLATEFGAAGTQFTVTALNNTAGSSQNDTFKVDSDIAEVRDLEQAIHDAFAGSGGSSELATYSLDYGPLTQVSLESPAPPAEESAPVEEPADDSASETAAESSTEDAAPEESSSGENSEPATTTDEPAATEPEEKASEAASDESEAKEPETASDANDQSSILSAEPGTLLAYADDAREVLLAQADTAEETAETAVEPSAPETTEVTPDATEGTAAEEAAPAVAAATSSRIDVDLTFGHAINAQTLTGEIETAAEELSLPISQFELVNETWDGTSSNVFEDWTLRIYADEAQTTQLLDHLKAKFADSPVWSSSSKIGGQVAGDMQQKAIAALVTSLFFIVLYIWIRFQRVMFGLAAVVALVHDVLVTLGAIALSAWLADALGFLLIEEFKISLPIVAALLTIIGYSLNDTIVVFDRIREVRGKSPNLTGDMINTSINQTIGRTVLTSVTTLIVVAILYAIGGDGIHGFAFSLVIGVIVGTYSSIFVASPVLLWMTSSNQKSSANKAASAAGKVSASA